MKKAVTCVLLLLSIAMILPAFASCGKKNDPSSTEITTESQKNTYPDDLEQYHFNFNNEEFNVLSVTDEEGDYRYTTFDLSDEEASENPDNLSMEIYRRNRLIEERFHIFLNSSYDSYWNCQSTLEKMIFNDLHDYDLIMLINRDAYTAAVNGQLIPVDRLTYVDQSKDYYLHDINDAMTLNGKQFLCYSEESLYTFGRTTCIAYNKNMAKSYGWEEEDVYGMVEDGTWTFEKLFEYMETATTLEDDVVTCYGMYGHMDYTVSTFLNAAGQDYITKTANNLKFDFTNEKTGDIINTVLQKMDNNNLAFETDYALGKANGCYDVFKNGKALFTGTVAGKLMMFLDIEQFDYGVLPWPKYNTEQTQYRSRVVDAWLHVVPANHPDPERASVILEALASGTSKNVFTAFYDRQLRFHAAGDVNSANALDICRATRTMDWGGTVFGQTIRSNIESNLFVKRNGESYATYCRSNLAGVVASLIKEVVDASKK